MAGEAGALRLGPSMMGPSGSACPWAGSKPPSEARSHTSVAASAFVTVSLSSGHLLMDIARKRLRSECGGDAEIPRHRHGAGIDQNAGTGATPAHKDGEERRRSRQCHSRAAVVGLRAVGPAADPARIRRHRAAGEKDILHTHV